ncbi:MAG TPA: nitroreductase/quinone reductase family protein [Novosphingobium sp.]|nr:nitroreductase/quinone reductase family protein [Novosphingobium sp.]
MSDESSAELIKSAGDFIGQHRDLYIQSGGAKGHIIDNRNVGGHYFATTCLIRYQGRKSGRWMITPLCYGDIGGEVVIVGSKGGADHHPSWYLNVHDMDEMQFQIATQAFRAKIREPEGAEREKVWTYMVDSYPYYANYQKSTDRLIPLVMLTPQEEIPVFTMDDFDRKG